MRAPSADPAMLFMASGYVDGASGMYKAKDVKNELLLLR